MFVFINKKSYMALFLFLVGIVLYHNVIGFEFIFYDDPTYINNIFYNSKGFWDSIFWAFTDVVNANWSPLTILSLLIDFNLYGVNAGGYHFTNIVLHSFNAILLFFVLCRLLENTKASFFVALLFLVHPINVESAAWISERKGLLASFFSLLAFIYFSKYKDNRNKYFYSLSLLFFLFGLMSKAVFVVLPVIFLLSIWYGCNLKNNRFYFNREVIVVLPFLLLALVFGLFTIYIHSKSGAIISGDLIPFPERIFNASNSYVFYLKQIFYPFNLSINYEYKPILFGSVIINFIIISSIFIAIYKYRFKYKYLVFGILWYTVLLLPVLGFIQSGLNAHADRYLYLPGVGIYILIILVLDTFISKGYVRPIIIKISVGIFYGLLFTISWIQIGNWRSSVHLFEHAYTIDDSNYVVNSNLANIYIIKGNYTKGFKYYEKAKSIAPTYYIMYLMVADNLVLLNKYELASMVLNDLLKVDMNNFYGNFKLAKIRVHQGEFNKAIKLLEKIIRLEKGNKVSEITYLLAYSYYKNKKYSKAINTISGGNNSNILISNKAKKLIEDINAAASKE